MTDLRKLVQSAVEMACKAGADAAEALLSQGKSLSIKVFEGQIESLEHAESSGIGFRVLVGKREGYAHTERIDAKGIKLAAKWAVENAAVGRENEFAGIADYPKGPDVGETFSEELAKVPLSEKVELARKIEAEPRAVDKRIVNVPHAGYFEGDFEIALANSQGLYRSRVGNYAGTYCAPLATEGESRQSGYKVEVSRSFPELSQKAVGVEAAKRALELLGAAPIESGSMPVMFENLTACELLGTFSGMFSGKAAEEGRTVLAGRVGEKIAAPAVRIVDDATRPGGFVSRAFDFEGYPTARFEIVSEGCFKGFMHNTATARKANAQSTGHAYRGYKGSLSVSPSNFFIEGEVRPFDALVGGMDRGLFIVDLEGLHSGANGLNGDFSLGAKGFLIEAGKRVRPVEGVTVSGNFLTMLNNIRAVGDDFKFDTPGGTTCIGAPSILVEALSIAGGKK
jgi:PmbA protein